jgi:hypothetical protein
MEARRTSTSLCRVVAVVEGVHRLAPVASLSEEPARRYFRNSTALTKMIERSGVLDNPSTLVALEQLLEEETPHGV